MKKIDVARHLGIGSMTYYHYELGSSNPPINVLKKLAILFNVSVDDLIGHDRWINPKKQMPTNEGSYYLYGKTGKMTVYGEGQYKKGKFYLDGQDVTKYVERWTHCPKKPEKL